MIRLVIDAATMRIVYFTTNKSQKLSLNSGVLLYDYHGRLPEKMSLENCWNWRLVGNSLVEPDPSKQTNKEQDLVEHNRKEAIKFLQERVRNIKSSLSTEYNLDMYTVFISSSDADFLNSLAKNKNLTIQEYNEHQQQFLNSIKTLELNKAECLKNLTSAKTNEEIVSIRDNIANNGLQTPLINTY